MANKLAYITLLHHPYMYVGGINALTLQWACTKWLFCWDTCCSRLDDSILNGIYNMDYSIRIICHVNITKPCKTRLHGNYPYQITIPRRSIENHFAQISPCYKMGINLSILKESIQQFLGVICISILTYHKSGRNKAENNYSSFLKQYSYLVHLNRAFSSLHKLAWINFLYI